MVWILAGSEDSAILKEIARGADRTAAIVAVAHLEDMLTGTLRAAFEGETQVVDRMLKGYGPLATLSAKIDLAHMLGMFPPPLRKSLFIIKDIRNEFAHTATKATFRSQRIRDLTGNLPKPVLAKMADRLSQEEVDKLFSLIQNPNRKFPEGFGLVQAFAVLRASIYIGKDSPRTRFMIVVQEALLILLIVKMLAVNTRNIQAWSRTIKSLGGKPREHAEYFWPWPSLGIAAEPSPPAPQNEHRKKKKQRPRRKASPA